MNAEETTQLLTLIASGEGRSEVNPAQAISWSFALDDVPAAVGLAAYRDAVKAGESYRMTPQTIRRYAAPHLRRIAASVRSAKLRGYVPKDWPDTRPLPPAAADRLRQEFEATNDLGEIAPDTTPPPKELDQ